MNIEKLKKSASNCNEVITLYRRILNSYVSDFYLEDHWNKNVPESWKQFMKPLGLADLGKIFDNKNNSSTTIAPLSIQCIFKILDTFSIPRKQVEMQQSKEDFEKYLWKNVKMKKRHELTIMASLCYQSAQKTDCLKLIDVGSGLGHLSRVLSFKYGMEVICIEESRSMSDLAPKLDHQFLNILKAKGISHKCHVLPKHVNMRVDENIDPLKFGSIMLSDIVGTPNFRCGIVGLHPCGNLGANILRLFRELPMIKFINMASCCYMKLTPNLGFPLSSYFIKNNIQLDYLSKEVACHALENYLEQLNLEEKVHFMKTHSYRAALECVLVNIDKKFAHGAICNVKLNDKMTFKEYVILATKKHDLDLNNIDFEKYEVLVDETWLDMVKLSILRLLLAPLVESSILYDRLLYLLEQVNDCDILSAFDCRISPRNQVICCTKC